MPRTELSPRRARRRLGDQAGRPSSTAPAALVLAPGSVPGSTSAMAAADVAPVRAASALKVRVRTRETTSAHRARGEDLLRPHPGRAAVAAVILQPHLRTAL
ncbi:hypothetical protein ACIHCQ_41230 [Streptomyces sp. NPDC052236]|uniref:hypothetical protein n=1 Tax=Streptomyces sp. NPDC052236 TaxID=3365686 RepID=UPI0037D59BC0